ncbi:MAG: TRAP transporter large permease [Selenomonas sp.]|jgi:tripartite ATP-independent transporter DctM subunit|nr:TRAP transporter large permease [Selenomonas sp.]MCI7331256.1 TRAP transporter large permease [Selenomonadaceae bacterium]MDD6120159.1 TRAP transporter large permease [Selenomonadaceae bacterium]MDD7056174.1 TRAP transporter large permease [Selenomonadaceae bacterium]MDY3916411.1 TRAP transporter large permease [Selenomonadaceae bacterium]
MFDHQLAIALLFGTFFVFIIARVPITFALAGSTAITMLYVHVPLMSLVQQMSKSINSFSLMAIPFFILAGEIMCVGGISDRLLAFANALVGRFRGGLSHVNIVASMFFGGISGSAVADVSSLGSVEIPMMVKAGYTPEFSTAITVTGACQGVLIPPSHNMIIYSLAAGGVSVGALFLGGFIPGVLLGCCLLVVSIYMSIKHKYPKGRAVGLKEFITTTKDALLALGTALIIFFGTALGFFTATESAAIACIYAFIVSFFIYRELKLNMIPGVLMNTVKTIAMVFSLIAAAGAFGWMMAFLKVPALITQGVLSISDNPVIILLAMNLLLLFLGAVMDMAPLIVIMTPILLPVATACGMSPVQFGVMLIYNLAIGLCTPPVGSALFVGCGISKMSLERVGKTMLPMYAAMLIGLMLVTFVPQLSMALPTMLGAVK